ncbi:hypothetical protein NH340_JMT08260 [Sarcoptes scabiei]|nr:hypothetical protein NH340_JMT08260 [Sarcoptes scabiei]
MRTITVRAPVNIAVIKYWGKSDEDLILPLNDSVSTTLSMDELCTTTTIAIGSDLSKNRFWLNNEEIPIEKRLAKVVDEAKKLAQSKWLDNEFVHICSKNNFPTAAGLASSASGLACLAFGFCKLFAIDDLDTISRLARLGSGSACRSIYGGIVQWVAGNDHQTSIATPIISNDAWPEIRILLLIVDDHKKAVSSTGGMQTSYKTSDLLQHRIKTIPSKVHRIKEAIFAKDFERFAEITMKDSNSFHAICQDTYPPIKYLNETSWLIVHFIHFLNDYFKRNVAAYTFDAGPNACIYCLETFVETLISLVQNLFPLSNNSKLLVNGAKWTQSLGSEYDSLLQDFIEKYRRPNAIKAIIHTKLGSGPQVVSESFDELSLFGTNALPRVYEK